VAGLWAFKIVKALLKGKGLLWKTRKAGKYRLGGGGGVQSGKSHVVVSTVNKKKGRKRGSIEKKKKKRGRMEGAKLKGQPSISAFGKTQ